MTYDEALDIARRATEEVVRQHGQDRVKVYEELRRRAQQDAKLMDAFSMTGNLMISAGQATRH